MQLALSKNIQNTKILLLSWRTNYAIIKSDQTSQMAAVNGLRINPNSTYYPYLPNIGFLIISWHLVGRALPWILANSYNYTHL